MIKNKIMKAFTDISQSKKLAEILPLESADMGWYYSRNPQVARNQMWVGTKAENADIPCWSLAALLDVIPKHIKDYNVLRIDISTNDFAIWYDEVGCGVNNELPDITMESAVDACYEMIKSLHELNLL
jgi:hypothetical protein